MRGSVELCVRVRSGTGAQCGAGAGAHRAARRCRLTVMESGAPEPRTQLYSSPVGLAASTSKLLRSEAAYGLLTEQLLGKKPPKGSLEG